MKKRSLPGWLRIAIGAGKHWVEHSAFKHSAAVSFYTLFSLAPITVISLTIAGFFFGRDAASAQFTEQMRQLIGPGAASVIEQTALSSQAEHRGWVSTLVGIVLLLVGATTVFAQLQESLNEVWSVRSKPTRNSIVVLLITRLISFAMVVTIGFLLLVSLILSTAMKSAVGYLDDHMPIPPALLQAADLGIGLAVITILFALIFKVMPDVEVRWREIWRGAFLTAILFSVGRFLIALYLAKSDIASIYGTAGSLVALLMWVYYSCAILIYGAEFTRAHREHRGLPIVPKPNAVLVREQIIEPPQHK